LASAPCGVVNLSNYEGKDDIMGTGASIVLIAAGAIIRFAITIHSTIGSTIVNWDIVGDVLMAAGGIGLLMSLIWMVTATRRHSTDDGAYIERVDRPSMS
jgi:drug/metabolite transporter superfamily protein YnfA